MAHRQPPQRRTRRRPSVVPTIAVAPAVGLVPAVVGLVVAVVVPIVGLVVAVVGFVAVMAIVVGLVAIVPAVVAAVVECRLLDQAGVGRVGLNRAAEPADGRRLGSGGNKAQRESAEGRRQNVLHLHLTSPLL